jgi:hypothetical protein
MKRTVLAIFLMLSLCNESRADMCFSDPVGAYARAEIVVAGYVDTVLRGFGGLPDTYIFVIENSMKGFDENDRSRLNIIKVLSYPYSSIGKGKQVLFLEENVHYDLFVTRSCSAIIPWHHFKRLDEYAGCSLPPHKVVRHEGFASDEYKYYKQGLSNWFGQTNALIMELKETHERYEEWNNKKNVFIIILSLCTLTLALYNFKPSLFVPTKRAT